MNDQRRTTFGHARARRLLWAALCATLAGSCKKTTPVSPPPPVLTSELASTQFRVADEMRAAIEMQVSGEPFAQLLSFDLAGFNRTLKKTDQYLDPATGTRRPEPFGYSLAVETYEYSKQPMNNLSFESGAGLSLMFGPVLNPGQETGDAAFDRLANRFQHFATASQSDGPEGTNLIVSPPPITNPLNFYGWPGLQPTFAEFARFDPAIAPLTGAIPNCTLAGSAGSLGYGNSGSTLQFANYECDYNSLKLVSRDTQTDKRLEPDALGYATWKQALWSITYWQTLHDATGNPIVEVAAADQAAVGQPNNQVVGRYVDPNTNQLVDGDPGVYLGDIPLEGWQGLLMMEEIDNKAALMLGQLASPEGTRLQPLGIQAALDYSYNAPLVYFPSAVSVSETPTAPDASLENKYFPQPTGFAIADAQSRLATLNGVLGGFAEAFAMTDRNNDQVGGSLPFLVTFDGDPFPRDNGLADGENTLHDRVLGVLKVALVNLDRLHYDPTARVLVDTATVSGTTVTRGTTVDTADLAQSILSLRTAYRALNSSLQLYSNDTPDARGAPGALAATPITGASYTGPLQEHLVELVRAQADFLASKLITSAGAVSNGYDLRSGTADGSATRLDAQAGALRALLEAYLTTSDQQYRNRAIEVYADLNRRFWMADARAYRTTAGVDDRMEYTPLAFGTLQGALRQYYKLVASAPARQDEGVTLLKRLGRLNKLVLNGWDDRNQDDVLDYPDECLPSGLQMAERTLTGELGYPQDNGDRDRDCVKEISVRELPAALAAKLVIRRQ